MLIFNACFLQLEEFDAEKLFRVSFDIKIKKP